jgi:hypothetical protein
LLYLPDEGSFYLLGLSCPLEGIPFLPVALRFTYPLDGIPFYLPGEGSSYLPDGIPFYLPDGSPFYPPDGRLLYPLDRGNQRYLPIGQLLEAHALIFTQNIKA